MSAYCRRLTSGAASSLAAAGHIPLPTRRPSCAIEFLVQPPPFDVNQRRGIVLSLRRRRESRPVWVIGAAGGGLSSETDAFDDEKKASTVCSYAVGDQKLGENHRGDDHQVEGNVEQRDRTVEVVVAAAVTVVLGVGNRVLYKLALVPLKRYPFFLAQLATFGYVLVYFSILYMRYHADLVTDEMLSLPKTPYVAVGLLEALGAASGMAAGAILSGAAIPILSQSFLVWQLILSYIFLGRRYRFNQLLGCFLVAVGVVITVASGSSTGSLMEANIFWSLLMVVSFLFQAADTILKEMIFLDADRKLKGRSVDLFVVNSYGSAFQALFICLLLPFLSKLWGIPFNQLPNYMSDAAACFVNVGTISSGCEGAPLLPLLFVIVNMSFNVSLLHLIKISSAVVSCLASTISVPIAVFLFTLPLPYVGVASSLPPGFVAGAVVLLVGVLIYSWTPLVRTPCSSPHQLTKPQ